MIIRKITIRNITSFKGEQTIDFTAEPLRSAGLFAITGDTGAGKSTILDAICLALYNRAPRFDDRELLKYITGQSPNSDIELRGSDTRNALRRGTTDGLCCVEFSTNEGVFRATWQLRIKRTGRYARPEQTLEQLAPHHKTFNPQDFANEIKRIIGLDYEQFTRTVILAQNSFSNFLKAHQNDKSALLEKITGTEIYALISKEVYRLNQEAQKAYEIKCSELKGLTAGHLDEFDLARLKNDKHLRESSLQSVDGKLDNLKKQVDWYDEYEKVSNELKTATDNYNEANRKFIEMRDDREKLARFDEVAAVKDKFLLIKEAEIRKSISKDDVETFREKENSRKNIYELALRDFEEAQNALAKAESQLEQQTPFLKKGHDLKRDILYDQNSINDRRNKIKETEDHALAHKKEMEAKNNELNAIGKQEELCEINLQELSVHQKMLEQSASVIEKLKRFSAIQNKGIRLNQEHKTRQDELETLRKGLSKIDDEFNILSQKQKSLIEQRELCKTRNLGLEGDQLQKSYDSAFALQEKLRGARKLWKEISTEYSEIEELSELKNRIATSLSYLAKEIEAMEVKIKQLHDIYDVRFKAYTLSQSEDIKSLRKGLKEGAPCPVCGATHHPYHTETEQHFGELITMIETNFREAETQLNNQTEELNAKKQKQSADNVRLNSIEEQIRKIHAQLQADIEEWKEYSNLDASFTNCSENVNRTARNIMLAQLADNADRTVSNAKTRLDEYNKNRNTIENFSASIEKISNQSEELQRRRSDLLRNIGQTESALEKAANEIKDNNISENELYSDLEDIITISNWQSLIRDNAEEFVGKIIAMAASQKKNIEQLQKLKGQRTEIEHDIKSLDTLLDDFEHNTQKIRKEIEMFTASINDKQNVIAGLFGREDPDDVERNMNSAVRITRDNFERKNAEEEEAKQEKLTSDYRNEIDRWIFTFNNTHSPVQYSELERIFKDTCNWNALRATIEKARTARILTEDRLKTTHEKLNMLEASPLHPDRNTESRSIIENNIARFKEEKNQISQQLAEINSKLRAHENSVEKIAQFEPELKALDENKANWSKLNTLVGSADGNLFRVQAQCFTLKLLVKHANVQLSNLSPRYRLQCISDSLGLEIIDRYMCDQKRPVSSLSGGETFIVSLGLALGLASLSSSNLSIGSLFIDEGFGNLDSESLAMVIKALGNLQNSQGRKVGIISHTSQIRESIHPQVQILKQKTEGYSYVRISGN